MNATEAAKVRFFAKEFRRYRQENERLREALGQETESGKAFDRENSELFQIVHANHARNTGAIATGMTLAAML